MTDQEFWRAIYRAIHTFIAALDEKPGAPSIRIAGRDALMQVSTAIKRRWMPSDM